MKRQFTARRVLKIYLEEADWKWVELQAEGNVSGWCRDRLLAKRERGVEVEVLKERDDRGKRKTGRRAPDVPRKAEVRSDGGRDVAPVGDVGVLCAHRYQVAACPFPDCENYKWGKR